MSTAINHPSLQAQSQALLAALAGAKSKELTLKLAPQTITAKSVDLDVLADSAPLDKDASNAVATPAATLEVAALDQTKPADSAQAYELDTTGGQSGLEAGAGGAASISPYAVMAVVVGAGAAIGTASGGAKPVVVAAPVENVITGTAGNDTLTGTSSNDRFVMTAGEDVIAGGAGQDTLDYRAAGDTYLNNGYGEDTGYASANIGMNYATQTFTSIEIVMTGAGSDTVQDRAGVFTSISTGLGEDNIEVTSLTTTVDGGGDDYDELYINVAGSINMNLYDGIEIFDFENGVANTITLTADQLLSIGATDNQIDIELDEFDTFTAGAGFTLTGSQTGPGYAAYEYTAILAGVTYMVNTYTYYGFDD